MKIEKDVEASESLALLARTQVSFRSRVGHLALLLLTTGFSVALVSLLLTEENLPVRAAAGLLASLAINLVWAIYAAWVLAVRRTGDYCQQQGERRADADHRRADDVRQ